MERPHNRFTYLLIVLIAYFLILPMISDKNLHFPFISCVFLGLLLFAHQPFVKKGKQMAFLVFLALAVTIPQIIYRGDFFVQYNYHHLTVSMIFNIIFIGVSVVILAKELFAIKKIAVEAIYGGICVYILLGIFFGFIYSLIYHFDLDAFSVAVMHEKDLFYFSFMTLLTVGYGDVTPVDSVVRGFAGLEALTGQMFLAIFISRLVGLYVAHEGR